MISVKSENYAFFDTLRPLWFYVNTTDYMELIRMEVPLPLEDSAWPTLPPWERLVPGGPNIQLYRLEMAPLLNKYY